MVQTTPYSTTNAPFATNHNVREGHDKLLSKNFFAEFFIKKSDKRKRKKQSDKHKKNEQEIEMQRVIEYILFFVTVVLLQALLFDNLMLSGLIVPLYYVVFVVLLPVKTGRIWLLLLGTLLGAVMDISMGTAGLNTIATVAVAFLRPMIINISMGKDVVHETIPYGGAIAPNSFLLYAAIMVLTHELIFFGFESLGSHIFYTLAKVVMSSLVTVVLVTLTARLFRRIVG